MARPTLVITLLLVTAAAHAETAPVATQQARTHFQAGLARAEQGNLSAALTEFEAAYATSPHFSVLYNIGQACSTLGRPVEAVAAFERYLTDGGNQITPNRRQEVETLLLSNRKQIGSVRITTDGHVPTRVWVDGTEVPRERFAKPVALAVGEHSVVYAGDNGPAESRLVSVTSREVTELKLAPPPPKPPGGITQLAIICETPGIDIDVNGEHRTQTPVTVPLLVPNGQVTVRFSRPGYRTLSRTLSATPRGTAALRCEATPAQPLPALFSARLLVRTTPPDAEIKVDGQRFLGAALPSGVHQLLIERDGFGSNERSISLVAGKTTTVDVRLAQTPAARDRSHGQTVRRKTVGAVLGSVGLAIVGTGIGIYAWNSRRYDDWRTKPNADLNRAVSIQRADDASFGLMLLGGGALVGASWLMFGTE